MLYLRRFSLPGQGAEASFLARDSENKRTCYGSRYPFGIFLSRKVPPLTFEPITILCGGNGCGKTTVLNLMAEKLKLRRGAVFNRSSFFQPYLDLCEAETAGAFGAAELENSRIITSDDVFDGLLDLRYMNENIEHRRKELLEEYIRFGGFPIIALSEYDEQSAYQIVNGIYHTVVSRDIVKRHRINKQDLFDRVVKYIIENMGKTFSANSISTFLKSEHRKVSVESIYNYLRWLEQAFIIYPCERYDLQGKSILKTQEKYYLADFSLKYALMGYNRKMLDGVIENIVFLELKRRGYDVFIGKNDTKEIDFVAIRRDEKIYVQVCVQLPEKSDREVGNLMEIKDHYPKYVVTLNDLDVGIENGIKIVHLSDFLLSSQW